jgi:hypothetical protein
MNTISALAQAAEMAGIGNRQWITDSLGTSVALKEVLKLADQRERWIKDLGCLSAVQQLHESMEKIESLSQYDRNWSMHDWRRSAVGAVEQMYETLQKEYAAIANVGRDYMLRRDTEAIAQLREMAKFDAISSLASEHHAMLGTHSAIQSAMEQVKALNYNIVESFNWSISASQHYGALQKFEIPVLDTAATVAMSQLWGRDGIARHLTSLGIDFDDLLQNWATEGDADEEQVTDTIISSISFQKRLDIESFLGNPRNNGIMAVLGLILSIYQVALMYMPSLAPNNSSESPQIAQLLEAQKSLAAQVEKLTQKIMEQLDENDGALSERVVRDRLAVIRERPQSGSRIVTKIFPNQVVTVLDEEGKWIRIRYYDFVQEEFYEGWALKKYFSRVYSRHIR